MKKKEDGTMIRGSNKSWSQLTNEAWNKYEAANEVMKKARNELESIQLCYNEIKANVDGHVDDTNENGRVPSHMAQIVELADCAAELRDVTENLANAKKDMKDAYRVYKSR